MPHRGVRFVEVWDPLHGPKRWAPVEVRQAFGYARRRADLVGVAHVTIVGRGTSRQVILYRGQPRPQRSVFAGGGDAPRLLSGTSTRRKR